MRSVKIVCACCHVRRRVAVYHNRPVPRICVECWTIPANRLRWPAIPAVVSPPSLESPLEALITRKGTP
ncbi:MAG: hypothetical protein K2X38_21940 [Gemmataceae bacterium]|nr:hypothetical protein [Gemmataceae bacterium]